MGFYSACPHLLPFAAELFEQGTHIAFPYNFSIPSKIGFLIC